MCIIPLGNDLDSIRALFSEKEKELSLAAAKVEALKRQLEEIRRHRHGTLNLIPGAAATLNSINLHSATTGLPNQRKGGNTSSAARELEKLRRELMVNKLVSSSFWFFFFFTCRHRGGSDNFESLFHLPTYSIIIINIVKCLLIFNIVSFNCFLICEPFSYA